jgi:hypothetical protein
VEKGLKRRKRKRLVFDDDIEKNEVGDSQEKKK